MISKVIKRIVAFIFLLFFLLLFLSSGAVFFFEIPIKILFGWINFILNVFPYVSFNMSKFVFWVLSVLLLTIGLHFFLSWFYNNYDKSGKSSRDKKLNNSYKIGWSITALTIFILMFVTSISITGILHQFSWLFDEPFIENSFKTRRVDYKMREIGNALESYYAEHKKYPVTNGTIDLEKAGLTLEFYNGPYTDHWGSPYKYSSNGHSYFLRSYGKNRILGGGKNAFDDIIFSNGEFIVP